MNYGASDGSKRFRVYFERDYVCDGWLVRKPTNIVVMANDEADARNIVEGRFANVDAFVTSAIEL